MHTPTQKQWQTVIDKLYSILPFTFESKYHLDISEAAVNNGWHQCGTVHCVGGWYAIASYKEDAFDRKEILSYSDGTAEMARDLGFENEIDLEFWAGENYKLWGNSYGLHLFYKRDAYDHGNGPAKSITDVIHHFEFVKQNCKKRGTKHDRS